MLCWGGNMCDTLRGKTNPHCTTRDASVMLQCRSVSLCSRLSEPAPQTLRSALCSGTQPPGDNTSLQLHSVTPGCSKEKGREAPDFPGSPGVNTPSCRQGRLSEQTNQGSPNKQRHIWRKQPHPQSTDENDHTHHTLTHPHICTQRLRQQKSKKQTRQTSRGDGQRPRGLCSVELL